MWHSCGIQWDTNVKTQCTGLVEQTPLHFCEDWGENKINKGDELKTKMWKMNTNPGWSCPWRLWSSFQNCCWGSARACRSPLPRKPLCPWGWQFKTVLCGSKVNSFGHIPNNTLVSRGTQPLPPAGCEETPRLLPGRMRSPRPSGAAVMTGSDRGAPGWC